MRTLRLAMMVAIVGFSLGVALAWLTRDDAPVKPEPGVEGAAVGDPQPGFRHDNLEGIPVSVEEFDGQALLVNFWATWCAPCRREMPVLQSASDRHAGQLTVVGIALDEIEPVRVFVDDLGIDYPVLVGSSAEVMDTQSAWGNGAGVLPYTVLVDTDGIIRWQHYGEVTAEELDEVLGDWL